MGTFISHSPDETRSLGAEWGRSATRGLVIAVSGELGAGKTQLVKGVGQGLGISEGIHSPTFTLLNVYGGGRLTLFHLDLYRLETREEISAAGLEEYFSPDGVAVIEWAERWFGNALGKEQPTGFGSQDRPRLFRSVLIEPINEFERRITYEDPGA